MPIDLTTLKAGELVINQKTKAPYLVLSNKEVHQNQVILLDIQTEKEMPYQADIDKAITLDRDMHQIQQGFNLDKTALDLKPIDLTVAEDLILNEKEVQLVKNILTDINNPKLYSEYVKT